MKHTLATETAYGHKPGGFSLKVWDTPAVQNYDDTWGWVGHEQRNDDRDRLLEKWLRAEGLSNNEIGEYIISKVGRWTGDSFSFGAEKAKKEIYTNITYLRRHPNC